MKAQKIQLTPWHGGECPVDFNAFVLVLTDRGEKILSIAEYIQWDKINGLSHDKVTAYAVIECEVIEPPHSTIIPPEVWAVLPDYLVCGASDEYGVYVMSKDASFTNGEWLADFIQPLNYFKGVIPAKCPWQDSLVWGPGCEPK